MAVLAPCGLRLLADAPVKSYGLNGHLPAKPFLLMPDRAGDSPPPLLSLTGAFADARNLSPSKSLIPYDINVSFWSDGASKSRWVAVPSGTAKIKFASTGEWTFPAGTVFVKHFDIATNENHPDLKRRLETRLLVRDSTGGVYGVTYKWRPDGTDADLLATNLTEIIPIQTASGVRTQNWYYPSRQDCLTCHTMNAGSVLGVKTRQMNRDFSYGDGATDNQLRAWSHAGLFDTELTDSQISACARLARADDSSRSLEDRARSYLDANCAHCHRPAGTVANFDARYDTPLADQKLIGGPILINEGIDNAQVVAPNDPWRSILFMRINTVEAVKMPPLAHEMLDGNSVELLRQWIHSIPGPPVLKPPAFSIRGGEFAKPIEVALSDDEPGAVIHYTLDGTTPTKADPLYEAPIRLTGPTTLRARAYKSGFTRSITVQQTYIVGE